MTQAAPAQSKIPTLTVPLRQEGADAPVLPRVHRDLLEVTADAGRPLRAAQFAAAAGCPRRRRRWRGYDRG
jgi:hypothetical protein